LSEDNAARANLSTYEGRNVAVNRLSEQENNTPAFGGAQWIKTELAHPETILVVD